jgi:hypothetical protein
MTTGADGGAAITALLGHPDHRSVTRQEHTAAISPVAVVDQF